MSINEQRDLCNLETSQNEGKKPRCTYTVSSLFRLLLRLYRDMPRSLHCDSCLFDVRVEAARPKGEYEHLRMPCFVMCTSLVLAGKRFRPGEDAQGRMLWLERYQ